MKELWDASGQAIIKTIATNPLHADMFPGVRQMESEIVRITIDIYNGDDNCVGLVTSGGTESILLAMLAYREWGR